MLVLNAMYLSECVDGLFMFGYRSGVLLTFLSEMCYFFLVVLCIAFESIVPF